MFSSPIRSPSPYFYMHRRPYRIQVSNPIVKVSVSFFDSPVRNCVLASKLEWQSFNSSDIIKYLLSSTQLRGLEL